MPKMAIFGQNAAKRSFQIALCQVLARGSEDYQLMAIFAKTRGKRMKTTPQALDERQRAFPDYV